MTLDELREQVRAEYVALDLPSWPNPHPDAHPADDEYSRTTDEARYRVVQARGRVWATVLEHTLGAAAEPWGPDAGFARGTRLTSARAGTLPLLLLESDTPLPSLRVSVADPSWVLTDEPYCGCDACDDGSELLLEAVDTAIGEFLQGPYVLIRGPEWSSSWHPGGGRAGGSPGHPGFDVLMAASRRIAAGEPVELPDGAEAIVSQPWLE